jgi:hypothetical protein
MANVVDEEKSAMALQKQPSVTEGDAPSSLSSGSHEIVAIDPAVQRKLVRKLDFYLLPWMALVRPPGPNNGFH